MAATTAEKQRAVEQQVNTDSLLKPSKSEKGVTVGKSNGGRDRKGKGGWREQPCHQGHIPEPL